MGAALSRGAGADAERQRWLRGGGPGPGPAGAVATPSSVVTKASGQFWPRAPGWACRAQGRLPPQGPSLGVRARRAGAHRAPWQLTGDVGPAWGRALPAACGHHPPPPPFSFRRSEQNRSDLGLRLSPGIASWLLGLPAAALGERRNLSAPLLPRLRGGYRLPKVARVRI